MSNPATRPSWLALDVGGANIKAAHSRGQARSLPFELWKMPEELPRILSSLAGTFPAFDRLALTMTAELCDCFPTKAAGVQGVLDAASRVAQGRPILIWATDGAFHPIEEMRQAPGLAAASNWLALATVAARLLPEGPALLIDVGSTTTDVVPLADGKPVPRGRSDTQRLRSGELIYAGVRRTPFCALATELTWRGAPIGLSAELFATTLDVYLTLGDVAPDPKDLSTADGRPATADAARDRLARMVGADRETFSADDAMTLSRAADSALMARLVASAERAASVLPSKPRGAIVCGSGEFLARRLALRVVAPGGTILSLEKEWGPVASSAACAHALVVLAEELPEPNGGENG